MIPDIHNRLARLEGDIKEIDEGIRNLSANLSELREQLQIERSENVKSPLLRQTDEPEPLIGTGCIPRRPRY